MYSSNFSLVSLLGEEDLLLIQILGKPVARIVKEDCQLFKYSKETFDVEAGIKNGVVVSMTARGHFSGYHHAIEFIGLSPLSLLLLNENTSFSFYANNKTGDRVYMKKEKDYVSAVSVLGQIADRSSQRGEIYQLRNKMLMRSKNKVQSITLDGFLQTLIDLYSNKTKRSKLSSLRLINKYGFKFQNQDTVNMLVDYVESHAPRISHSQ